jgi:hypothetical protein
MKQKLSQLFVAMIVTATAVTLSPNISRAQDNWSCGHSGVFRWFMSEMRGNHGGYGMKMHQRFSETWFETVKLELGITAAQDKLWTDYVTKAQSTQENMVASCDGMMKQDATVKLPDRIQQHQAMMESHVASRKPVDDALLALYNALSPEQQKTADAVFVGMGMM